MGTGRLNTCPSMKSKRVFHSVSLSISEFNAFSHVCNIITRAARSAHLSSTLSATIVLSLVFFNPPSHSDTIPHTLSSFCANCSRFRFPLFLKIFFFLFFFFTRTLFIFNGMHLLADRSLARSWIL